MFQEVYAVPQENVSWVKLQQYPIIPIPQVGYGDNGKISFTK